MRKSIAAVVAAVFAGGCMYTQQELQDVGTRYTQASSDPPRRAASCVARGIEESGQQSVSLREAAQSGAWEVAMRAPDIGMLQVYALAVPKGSGSTITLWVIPTALAPERFADAMKGC